MEHVMKAELALKKMLDHGADKAQALCSFKKITEFNVEAGKLSLLRTVESGELFLQFLKNKKLATTSLNDLSEENLETVIGGLVLNAQAGVEDEAYDFASAKAEKTFTDGPLVPNEEQLYLRVTEAIRDVTTRFPHTAIEQMIVKHVLDRKCLLNSSQVKFETQSGVYEVVCMFTSKKGDKTSSFDYVGFSLNELNQKFLDCAGLANRLKESEEHLEAQVLNDKFEGELIIAPNSFGDFINPFLDHLRNNKLISGSSRLKDSLNQAVISPKLTIRLGPQSDEFTYKTFFNADGFEEENMTLVEKGVLKSFLLSLYGANKTGLKRSQASANSHMIIEKGHLPYSDLIKNVKKGVLINRFSGGMPNSNGDFSGIAKNSFYIENGKILYPIKETMVSGNVFDVLKNVTDLSKESLHFGDFTCPWMRTHGVVISGK